MNFLPKSSKERETEREGGMQGERGGDSEGGGGRREPETGRHRERGQD